MVEKQYKFVGSKKLSALRKGDLFNWGFDNDEPTRVFIGESEIRPDWYIYEDITGDGPLSTNRSSDIIVNLFEKIKTYSLTVGLTQEELDVIANYWQQWKNTVGAPALV